MIDGNRFKLEVQCDIIYNNINTELALYKIKYSMCNVEYVRYPCCYNL